MIVYVSYKLDAKEIGNGREGRGKAKIIRTDFFPPARGRIISSLPPPSFETLFIHGKVLKPVATPPSLIIALFFASDRAE